ncbi:MAG: EAL domain-containing protein [Pseudomonadota bacterium]
MDEVLKILVLSSNANSADNIVRTAKLSGFAVRDTIISSKEEFSKSLEDIQHYHIAIITEDFSELSVEEISASIKGDDYYVSLIALSNDITHQQSRLISDGADIVLATDDNEQLGHAITKIANTELYIRNLQSKSDAYEDLNQRYQKILDISQDAICYIHEGLHTYVNKSYMKLFDIEDMEDASALSILELVDAEDQEQLKEILKDVHKNKSSGDLTLNFKTGNKVQALETTYDPVIVEGEVCTQFVIHWEVESSEELQEQLNYISERDLETGFFHRKSIIDRLQELLDVDRTEECHYTFVQIDIANLESIQDQHGVVAIDQLGSHIANILQSSCDDEELLAKITDKSYGIITDITDKDELITFGKNLRDAFEVAPLKVKGIAIEPEFYIGAVLLDGAIEDASDALATAKSACDTAWENNLHELYLFERDPSTLTGTMRDQTWKQELQNAIKEDRLKLQFQPIICTNSDNIDRYQVYSQLISKDGDKIPVSGILPSIERSGISSMFDRWVVKLSLKKLAEHTQTNPNSQFFIKLTAGAVSDDEFIPWLSKECDEKGIAPSRVIFDLREEIAINNLKGTRTFATELKSLGFDTAIDSFGIGEDPSKILTIIPACYLKLSFQLISGLKENDQDKIQEIRNICDTARSSGAKIVAQFVENAEVLSQLWTMNIEYISGDFFCKVGDNLEYDFSSAA